ncbi:hypothetical protein ABZW11_40180 [Nonomuraea sp. NPDC004580]|uniref:hypothetical protein n=1 Tax=Nonomuraea sp. NPDC004580 TaxID=3154552 RepID=UPI00339F16A0
MAITLPPQLDATLELAGLWFPNIDEDEIHADADAARIVQAYTAQEGANADATVRGAAGLHRGDSGVALQSAWDASDTANGHLAQATAATRIAPAALDGLGYVVTGTKVAVGTIAAVGTVRLLYALMAGGPAAGLTTTATLLAIRRAGTKVLREAAEGTGRHMAPALTRRATAPLRDILSRLRPPGPPGSPALAGAGRLPGGRVPVDPKSFDRNPGILQIRRKKKSDGGGGGWSRNSPASFDNNAQRMHGRLPSSNDVGKMSPEQAAEAAKQVKDSILTRKMNEARLGKDAGHQARLRDEQKLLEELERKANEGK